MIYKREKNIHMLLRSHKINNLNIFSGKKKLENTQAIWETNEYSDLRSVRVVAIGTVKLESWFPNNC